MLNPIDAQIFQENLHEDNLSPHLAFQMNPIRRKSVSIDFLFWSMTFLALELTTWLSTGCSSEVVMALHPQSMTVVVQQWFHVFNFFRHWCGKDLIQTIVQQWKKLLGNDLMCLKRSLDLGGKGRTNLIEN